MRKLLLQSCWHVVPGQRIVAISLSQDHARGDGNLHTSTEENLLWTVGGWGEREGEGGREGGREEWWGRGGKGGREGGEGEEGRREKGEESIIYHVALCSDKGGWMVVGRHLGVLAWGLGSSYTCTCLKCNVQSVSFGNGDV